MLILDVDGVLTDGKKYYDNTGKGIYKTFCDRDFTSIKKFRAAGWTVVFLSGDKNVNQQIAINRNIPFYCNRGEDGMVDKAKFVDVLEEVYETDRDNMVYVGDDVFDINIMKEVGHKLCPADAADEVKEIAHVLRSKGGDNVISEVYQYFCYLGLVEKVDVNRVIDLDKHEKF